MTVRPRLLVVSAVHPFPRTAGQQQRVYFKLQALKPHFRISFLTVAPASETAEVRRRLLEICDEAIVLPSIYSSGWPARLVHKLRGLVFMFARGLKFSNYLIGELEFAPERLDRITAGRAFDCVLYEYWHAYRSADVFRQRGAFTVLDMHDILWQSFKRQLSVRPLIPTAVKHWLVERYRRHEEQAWDRYDALIAINREEFDYVRERVGNRAAVLYAPMGTDLSEWTYDPQPAAPIRIAYYGSLGSKHNQSDALRCYREIMPRVWQDCPDVEFWIVGSNPPGEIRELASDPRVTVTGFVERPQTVLRSMALVLCPWLGTYGFRSRIVEVMALGVPVIASDDAVQGMGIEPGEGILTAGDTAGMAGLCLAWLRDPGLLAVQGRKAREQVERQFGFEATYGRFAQELLVLTTR